MKTIAKVYWDILMIGRMNLCNIVEEGHGWKELCTFLKLPIPKEPFPLAATAGKYGWRKDTIYRIKLKWHRIRKLIQF